MDSNCKGYGQSFEASMRSYDQLPPAVREKLMYAQVDWSAGDYLKMHRCGCSDLQISVEIDAADEWFREKTRSAASIFMRKLSRGEKVT